MDAAGRCGERRRCGGSAARLIYALSSTFGAPLSCLNGQGYSYRSRVWRVLAGCDVRTGVWSGACCSFSFYDDT